MSKCGFQDADVSGRHGFWMSNFKMEKMIDIIAIGSITSISTFIKNKL